MALKNEAFFRQHYKDLKILTVEQAEKAKIQQFATSLKNSGDTQTSPESAKDKFVTFVKLAHSLSEDEFVEAAINNEMPPIKLTAKEMAVMKGGFSHPAVMPHGIAAGEDLYSNGYNKPMGHGAHDHPGNHNNGNHHQIGNHHQPGDHHKVGNHHQPGQRRHGKR